MVFRVWTGKTQLLKMAALPLLLTNDHLVICFLRVTASEPKGVHESLRVFVTRSCLALYLEGGGGGELGSVIRLQSILKASRTWFVCTWHIIDFSLQPLSTAVPFARSRMLTDVGEPAIWEGGIARWIKLPFSLLIFCWPCLPNSLCREPWKRPCPRWEAPPSFSQGGWRDIYLLTALIFLYLPIWILQNTPSAPFSVKCK